jgi:hypothetical protein
MVVPLEPAEKWPLMKTPVGNFTLPLKVEWSNSYEKVVDDIVEGCVVEYLGVEDDKRPLSD